MITELDETIIQELREILEKDSGEKVRYYHEDNLYAFDTAYNELELHLKEQDNKIVITRVEFFNERKGKLTKVIDIISKLEWVEAVEMQFVITEAGQQYCKSRGFHQEGEKRHNYIKWLKNYN